MGDGQANADLTAAQAEAYAVLSRHFGEHLLTPLPATIAHKAGSVGAVAWSLPLPVDHTGAARELRFVLPAAFPDAAPIVLVEPSAYGAWPHATIEGGLCLWYDGMAPVGKRPADQIALVLERVADVLSPIYPEPDHARIEAEFGQEWLSYWLPPDPSITRASALLLAAVPATTAPLSAHVANTADKRTFVLIGGETNHVEAWATALGISQSSVRSLEALYVPVSRPIVGAPASLRQLLQVLKSVSPDAAAQLAARLTQVEGPFFVVFGLEGDAPSFAALELTLAPDMRPQPGAYTGKEARNRRIRRQPDAWRVKVMSIDRADHDWIHGRAFDLEAQQLVGAHVWVIGCGSLGGLIIRGLAAAGVGRLTIVDDERLEVANLGRHVLTARNLGHFKAAALAAQVREQLPHLRVDALSKRYPQVRPIEGGEAPNLIISATASWPADLRLINDLAAGRHAWVQFTWAEPHAVAGHALLANARSDVRTLFADDGRFLRACTQWPVSSRRLPGCAGTHQPGTFNRLQRIAGLAVEQAIAHLLGHGQVEHLAWLGDNATLQRLGGSWRANAAMPLGVRERTLALAVPPRAA